MRVVKTDDVEEVRALYNACLPAGSWHHDEHEHWLLVDELDGFVAGFCSAVYWPELDSVFLSAAGVVMDARGTGLQRRMINVRLSWAKRQGAKYVVTYTAQDNYASTYNLLKRGFHAELYKGWNVFTKGLGGYDEPPEELKARMIRKLG